VRDVQRLLVPGERVHLVTREHGIVLLRPLAGVVAAVAAFALLLRLAAASGWPPARAIAVVPGVGLVGWALVRLGRAARRWWRRRLLVTDRRAVLVSGRLRRRYASLPLDAVEDAEIACSGLGRRLRYGGVVVHVDGRRRRLFGLRRLPDADLVFALVVALASEHPGVAAARPRRSRVALSA
jgi:hypothetical protein